MAFCRSINSTFLSVRNWEKHCSRRVAGPPNTTPWVAPKREKYKDAISTFLISDLILYYKNGKYFNRRNFSKRRFFTRGWAGGWINFGESKNFPR